MWRTSNTCLKICDNKFTLMTPDFRSSSSPFNSLPSFHLFFWQYFKPSIVTHFTIYPWFPLRCPFRLSFSTITISITVRSDWLPSYLQNNVCHLILFQLLTFLFTINFSFFIYDNNMHKLYSSLFKSCRTSSLLSLCNLLTISFVFTVMDEDIWNIHPLKRISRA